MDTALQRKIEALLNEASFNYEEGNTRQLIRDTREALITSAKKPTTFYYDVRMGRMEADRRLTARPRVPAHH